MGNQETKEEKPRPMTFRNVVTSLMGNQNAEVQKPTSMPLMEIESNVINSDDVKERSIRNLPRKLGSMLLSQWITFKRRERAVLEKAKVAVSEGKAPPSILEEIEEKIKEDEEKHRVTYSQKILKEVIVPKVKSPKRLLKPPKLTNTAATRIRNSYLLRDLERRSSMVFTSIDNTTILPHCTHRYGSSSRSIAWAAAKRKNSSLDMSDLLRKDSEGRLKPSSRDPSLDSVTTNESGIGMSRTVSMSSVASSMHKVLYSRRRVSEVTAGNTLKSNLHTFEARQKKEIAEKSTGSSKWDIINNNSKTGREKRLTRKRKDSERKRSLSSYLINSVKEKGSERDYENKISCNKVTSAKCQRKSKLNSTLLCEKYKLCASDTLDLEIEAKRIETFDKKSQSSTDNTQSLEGKQLLERKANRMRYSATKETNIVPDIIVSREGSDTDDPDYSRASTKEEKLRKQSEPNRKLRPQTAQATSQRKEKLHVPQQRRRLPTARGRELTRSFRKNLEEQDLSLSRHSSRPSSVSVIGRKPQSNSESLQQDLEAALNRVDDKLESNGNEPDQNVTKDFSFIQQNVDLQNQSNSEPTRFIDGDLQESINFQMHTHSPKQNENANHPSVINSTTKQTTKVHKESDPKTYNKRQTSGQSSRGTTPTPRIHSCRKIEQSIENRLESELINKENNRKRSAYNRPQLSRSQSQLHIRRSANLGRRHSLQLGSSGSEPLLSSKRLSRSYSQSSQLDQIHLQHPLNQQLSLPRKVNRLQSARYHLRSHPSKVASIESEIVPQQRSPALNRKLQRRLSDPLDKRVSFGQTSNSPKHSQVINNHMGNSLQRSKTILKTGSSPRNSQLALENISASPRQSHTKHKTDNSPSHSQITKDDASNSPRHSLSVGNSPRHSLSVGNSPRHSLQIDSSPSHSISIDNSPRHSLSIDSSPRHTQLIHDDIGTSPRHSQILQQQPDSADVPNEPNVSQHNNEGISFENERPEHIYEAVNYNDLQNFERSLDQLNSSLADQPLQRQDRHVFSNSVDARPNTMMSSYRQRIHSSEPVESLHRISSRHYPDQVHQSSRRHSSASVSNRMKSHSFDNLERRYNHFPTERINPVSTSRSIDHFNYNRQSARYPSNGTSYRSSTALSRNDLNSGFTATAYPLDSFGDRSRMSSRDNIHMLSAEENWNNQRFINTSQANNLLHSEQSYPQQLLNQDDFAGSPKGTIIQVKPTRSRRSSGRKSHRNSATQTRSSRKRRPSARMSAKHNCVKDARENAKVKKVKKTRKYMTSRSTSTTLDHMEIQHVRDFLEKQNQPIKIVTPSTVLKSFDPLDYKRGEPIELLEIKSPRHSVGQLNDAGTSMNNRYDQQLFVYRSPRHQPRLIESSTVNQDFMRPSTRPLEPSNSLLVPVPQLNRLKGGASSEGDDFIFSVDASPRRFNTSTALEPLQVAKPVHSLRNGSAFVHHSSRSMGVRSAMPSRNDGHKISGRAILIKKGSRPSTFHTSRRVEAVEVSNVGGGKERPRQHGDGYRYSPLYVPRAL